MSDVFPKWTNRLPRKLAVAITLTVLAAIAGIAYYFTPKYTRVGYTPFQPVAFSHNTHVRQAGLDCRYCHTSTSKSPYASLPPTSTCMNCHNQILKDDPRLALVRESATTGKPIQWMQVCKLADYVYFDHSVHVNRGVSCKECHGSVDKMDETGNAESLSMSFCLDCHRNPAPRLRPLDKVTQLDWQPTNNAGANLARDWNVQKLQSCSTCHR